MNIHFLASSSTLEYGRGNYFKQKGITLEVIFDVISSAARLECNVYDKNYAIDVPLSADMFTLGAETLRIAALLFPQILNEDGDVKIERFNAMLQHPLCLDLLLSCPIAAPLTQKGIRFGASNVISWDKFMKLVRAQRETYELKYIYSKLDAPTDLLSLVGNLSHQDAAFIEASDQLASIVHPQQWAKRYHKMVAASSDFDFESFVHFWTVCRNSSQIDDDEAILEELSGDMRLGSTRAFIERESIGRAALWVLCFMLDASCTQRIRPAAVKDAVKQKDSLAHEYICSHDWLSPMLDVTDEEFLAVHSGQWYDPSLAGIPISTLYDDWSNYLAQRWNRRASDALFGCLCEEGATLVDCRALLRALTDRNANAHVWDVIESCPYLLDILSCPSTWIVPFTGLSNDDEWQPFRGIVYSSSCYDDPIAFFRRYSMAAGAAGANSARFLRPPI